MRKAAIPLVVVVLTCTAALALQEVIEPGWRFDFAVMLVLVGAVASGARLIAERYDKRPLLMPTLVSGLFGAWLLLTRYGGIANGYIAVPQLGSLGRISWLMPQALYEIQTTSAPMAPTIAIQFITCASGIAIFLIANLLANTKLAYLAVLPTLAFWAPTLGLGWRVGGASFVLTSLASLVLLLVASPQDARSRQVSGRLRVGSPPPGHRHAWRLATCSVLAIAVALGVGANAFTANRLDSYRLLPSYRSGAGSKIGAILNTDQPLTDNPGLVLFEYTVHDITTTGDRIGSTASQPFRVTTFTDFDGRSWIARPTELIETPAKEPIADGGSIYDYENLLRNDLDSFDIKSDSARLDNSAEFMAGSSAEDAVELPSPKELISITMLNYADPRLPITSEPRSVSNGFNAGNWTWQFDTANDVVYPDNQMKTGSYVEILSYKRDLSPENLRTIPLTNAAQNVPVEYLDIPNRNSKKVAQAAQEIVGDATTIFDVAMALSTHLSDPEIYTYSALPPETKSGNLVLDLLESRSGYCVHFASTMVMLARALDIPARLAVGYLPGTQVTESRWQVTSANAHAWAELYFGPELGWVPFDPTPQNPNAVPFANALLTSWYSYNDNSGEDGEYYLAPGDPGWEEFMPTYARDFYLNNLDALADQENATYQSLPLTGALAATPWQYWSAAGGALLVGLAVFSTRRVWRKRHRHLTEEAAWKRATETLERRGITIRTATTPRQLEATVVAGWVQKYQDQPPAQLLQALNTITHAVEVARYCNNSNPVISTELKPALNTELNSALRVVQKTRKPVRAAAKA